MPKLFYILMFIFGPIPAIYLGWAISYYKWLPIMNALVFSLYIMCAILLIWIRNVGGPEQKTRKKIMFKKGGIK